MTRETGRIDAAPQPVPDSGKFLWDNRFLVEAEAGAMVRPMGSRKLPALPGVPVWAQRACPWVLQSPEAAPPQVTFLRLNPGR